MKSTFRSRLCPLAVSVILLSAPHCRAFAMETPPPRVLPPGFSVSPGKLQFGTVAVGSWAEDSVTVRNVGSQPILILRIKTTDPQFSCTPTGMFQVQPSDSLRFRIRFTPQDTGLFVAALVFDEQYTVSLTARGSGTPTPPIFSLSRSRVALGNVDTRLGAYDTLGVSNRGTGLLYVSRIRPGHSDCLLYSPWSDTVAILPGRTRTYTLSFKPQYPGPVSFAVYFDHNAPSHTDSVLVTATATGDTAAPHLDGDLSPLDFGSVPTGVTKADTILLWNLGRPGLTIEASVSKHWSLPKESYYIGNNGFLRLIVSFQSLTPGDFRGWLVLRHNGNFGAMRTDSVALHAVAVGDTLAPEFTAEPALLEVGAVKLGDTRKDSLRVRNTGSSTLDVYTVYALDGSWSVLPRSSASIPPGNSVVYAVTFTPKSYGIKNTSLLFYLGGGKTDSIPLRGRCDAGVDGPLLDLDARAIAAGSVPVDSIRKATLRVRNLGRSPLAIPHITASPAWLHVTPDSMTLAPLEERSVAVTIAPRDTGMLNAAIVFESNTTLGRDTVPVSGRAVRLLPLRLARLAAPGDIIAFEGYVTRYRGSMLRMQDSTAAIAVRVGMGRLKKDLDNHAIDGRLRIIGRVSEAHALTLVDSADVVDYEVIPTRSQPSYYGRQLTLADIARDGERYESELIRVDPMFLDRSFGVWHPSTTYPVLDRSDSSHTVVIAVPDSAETEFNNIPVLGRGEATFNGVLSQYSDGDPRAGYRLLLVWMFDIFHSSLPVEDVAALPGTPHLDVFPHPVTSAATIRVSIATRGMIRLDVINTLGTHVRTLLDAEKPAGVHTVIWSATDGASRRLPAGVYFLTLSVLPTDGSAPLRSFSRLVLLP